MIRLRHAAVIAAPPIAALIFLGLWILAEAGRFVSEPSGWWMSSWLPFALIAASIAVARLLPVVSLVLVGILLVGQLLSVLAPLQNTSWPVYLGLLATAAMVAWSGSRRYLLGVFVVFGVFSVLLAAQVTRDVVRVRFGDSWIGIGDPQTWIMGAGLTILFFALATSCWFLGFAQRVRRERASAAAERLAFESELADSELEVMLASERDRIAQDVHDIMAHSLSVIVAQADGARFLAPTRPGAVDEALSAIAESARGSLVEVRMLMDALQSEPQGHSQPGLDEIAELTERLVGAGLVVSVEEFGERHEVTGMQQLAVYRIVQESLTNALRHAGSDATARIVFDWRGPGLALTISSRGIPEQAPHDGQSPGRGIPGMRERARLAGGWLTAGPDVGGAQQSEFIVTAFVPTPVSLDAGVA